MKKPSRIVIAIIIVIALAGIYTGYRLVLRRGVETRLAAIRAQGLPATPAELDQWYAAVPEAENAATIYLEAFSKIQDPSTNLLERLPYTSGTNLTPRTAVISADLLAAMSECVSNNTETLTLLHDAGTRPACRYPVDLTKGFATLLPHVSKLRTSARLLMLAATLDATAGRSEAAVTKVQDAVRMGESLQREPIVISQLVRTACFGIAASGLEQVASRAQLNEDQLRRLASQLATMNDSNMMLTAMIGEQTMSGDILHISWRELASLSGVTEPSSIHGTLSLAWFTASGLKDRNVQTLLDMHAELVAASRQPPPACLLSSKATELRVERLSNVTIFVKTMISTLHRCFEIGVSHTARVRAVQAGIAVERYRLGHGRLPVTLDELVPSYLASVSVDPFDGKPIRYKVLPSGFVVYSVGVNGKDDEGDGVKSASSDTPDITFTVEKAQ